MVVRMMNNHGGCNIIGLMDKEMGGSKPGNKHSKKGTNHNGYDMRTVTKNTCFTWLNHGEK